MWIVLKDAFLSVVVPSAADRRRFGNEQTGDLLMVRARAQGDIDKVLPFATVHETPDRDYRFRAIVPRSRVAEAMALEVDRIDYGNFKNSVAEDDRHDAYAEVWQAMFRFQGLRQRVTRAVKRRR